MNEPKIVEIVIRMKPQWVAYIMYFLAKSESVFLSKFHQKDKNWLARKNSAMDHLNTKYVVDTLFSVILRRKEL